MRVLIAPDSFTGTLTAGQAAAALAAGWSGQAPHDELDLCPLSDGGPGFVAVIHGALGGRLLPVEVPGPLGEAVTATVLLVTDPATGLTVYLESAQACGLHLVPEDRRDPRRTSTAGVAGLLTAARDAGATRIVLGLGGSGTNDAGAGMLAVLAGDDLGASVRARLLSGGGALGGFTAQELSGLTATRRRWADCELIVATDVDIALLGLDGASAGFAEQKGATPEQAQDLERHVGDFAHAALAATGLDRRLIGQPGAGAAGGLGFALLLLGGQRVPGAGTVLAAVDLPGRAAAADMVVSGEGCFDWQSLHGKVVSSVAAQALQTGIPLVVIAGQVLLGRRETLSLGVASAYPVARNPAEVAASLADPGASLAALAGRVARTWSPARPG